jgi:hypothetical protein
VAHNAKARLSACHGIRPEDAARLDRIMACAGVTRCADHRLDGVSGRDSKTWHSQEKAAVPKFGGNHITETGVTYVCRVVAMTG